MKKINLFKVLVVLLTITGCLFGTNIFSSLISYANTHHDDKITICHATGSASNPYNRIVVDEHADNGHFHNNGTKKSGHEQDLYFHGEVNCPGPDPSPTPRPTPTATPRPTPTATPRPTPTATPRPSHFPSNYPCSTPTCSSPTPTATPIVSPVPSTSPETSPETSPTASPSTSPEVSPTASPESSSSPEASPQSSSSPSDNNDNGTGGSSVDTTDHNSAGTPPNNSGSNNSGGEVKSATTQTGEVLAATGTFSENLAFLIMTIGFCIATCSAYAYIKIGN